MSGSATTTVGDASDDLPPPPDSSGDDPPPPPTTDSGECPFGTEGCLCDVGAMCDEGLTCNDEGVCVAPPACRPLDTDPHGDEASAYPLDPLDCGNGNDLGVAATIVGPETDWYTYEGAEAFGCPENPAVAVMADISLDVCVFLECIQGDASPLMCGMGNMNADSPDGRPGCCGVDQALIAGYDCFGGFPSSKDVNVWISVGTGEAACVDYAMSYAF
jgi:hypothetical protein